MKTTPCCWHCCHPAENLFHLPYEYDGKLKQFSTMGQFCSWSCMKSWALENIRVGPTRVTENIALMRLHMEGKYTKTKCAPPKLCLDIFGGDMDIDEFRQSCDIPVVISMPNQIERHVKVIRLDKAPQPRKAQTSTAASGGQMRVQRKNPLKSTTSGLKLKLKSKVSVKVPESSAGMYAPLSPH